MPLSSKILLGHLGMIAIFVALTVTIGRKAGAMHPVLVPFFFYMLFCWIPFIITLCVGISELKEKNKKKASTITVGFSLLSLIAIGGFVIYMFPKWMGV